MLARRDDTYHRQRAFATPETGRCESADRIRQSVQVLGSASRNSGLLRRAKGGRLVAAGLQQREYRTFSMVSYDCLIPVLTAEMRGLRELLVL